MSYLRAPYYVWSDGTYIHIWLKKADPSEDSTIADCEFPRGIKMKTDVWDALCLMRVAQIEAEHDRRAYELDALHKYGGNTGSSDLYERCGIVPPWVAK